MYEDQVCVCGRGEGVGGDVGMFYCRAMVASVFLSCCICICEHFLLVSTSQLVDYRVEFSKWWTNEFKNIKFPSQGTVFDYYLESKSKKWAPWVDIVPKFEFDAELPLQVCTISDVAVTFIAVHLACLDIYHSMFLCTYVTVMRLQTA